MVLFLSSFLLATSLLLSVVPLPASATSCSSGELKLWRFLPDGAKDVNFNGNQERALRENPKKACICDTVDADEISAFISAGRANDVPWGRAVDKLTNQQIKRALKNWLDSNRDRPCPEPRNGHVSCSNNQCDATCDSPFELVTRRGEKKCECPLNFTFVPRTRSSPARCECSSPNFVLSGSSCVCPPSFNYDQADERCRVCDPAKLCSGVCHKRRKACASQVVVPRARGLQKGEEECERREGGKGAWKFCPVGEVSAHALQGEVHGWECLNVASGLESCGGCPSNSALISGQGSHAAPHPALDALAIAASLLLLPRDVTIGQDCSAIPNVNSVECIQGSCVVNSCLHGFTLSEGGACEKASLVGSSADL
ncbi:hypothetical protein BDY24DRAFT_417443 [Mrakia frigida]|uniref:uncharacterized protein n=1 Tax=Mrakia frigida TaxID=29902 RepID=UPI003FCBF0A7